MSQFFIISSLSVLILSFHVIPGGKRFYLILEICNGRLTLSFYLQFCQYFSMSRNRNFIILNSKWISVVSWVNNLPEVHEEAYSCSIYYLCRSSLLLLILSLNSKHFTFLDEFCLSLKHHFLYLKFPLHRFHLTRFA